MPIKTFQRGVSPTADYHGGRDAFLYKNGATNNYGITGTIDLYISSGFERRGLLFFSIGEIPTGATVSSASVFVRTSAGCIAGCVLAVHKGLVRWVEGTKSNAQADAGEPCWNAREADGAGGVTTAWGAAGGLAGTDYVAVAEGSVGIVANATWYSVDITALVQTWVDNPASNCGVWLLRPDATGSVTTLVSQNNGTTANRPYLTAAYTTTMAPSIMML